MTPREAAEGVSGLLGLTQSVVTGDEGAVSLVASRAVDVGQAHVVGATRLVTPAEQVAVEVLPEGLADAVESDGVDAGVDEAQTEADDPVAVPEGIEVVLSRRVEVEPEHEGVVGQEAHDEDDDKGEHHFGDFFTSANLIRLPLKLAGHVPCT